MAIGSDAEIGVRFSTWGTMNDRERAEWFTQMREWGSDGAAGYGTVAYPNPDRIARYHQMWRNT